MKILYPERSTAKPKDLHPLAGDPSTSVGISEGILLFLIRLYQLALSPFLGTNCRFEPSCSCYAQDALKTHGAMKGTSLTIKRLLRCHPFAKAGYDPVPVMSDQSSEPSFSELRTLITGHSKYLQRKP